MERLTKLVEGKYVVDPDVTIDEIVNHLGEYESAEKDGLLLRLPCKEGTKVYEIVEECNALSCVKKSCKKCGYYNPHIVPKTLSLEQIVKKMDQFDETIFFLEEKAQEKLKEFKN